jgi:hypothetical protein
MTIATALCNSFKTELLAMTPHTAADSYFVVLVKSGHSGIYGAGTTSVGTPGTGTPTASNLGTDAVAASGGYTSVNGVVLAGFAALLDTSTGILTFTDPAAWAAATISADGCIIYNSSRSNKALATYSFGGTVSSTAGNFDVNLPAAVAATALIRIS